MMNKKRTIATLASMIIGINTVSITGVNAKVIEPEIVKTETWITSYFIDDDIETLYPYIDCQADIYNDGTVKVYFWNTHEWDGFTTVKHDVKIINSTPYNNFTDCTLYYSKSHPNYTILSEPFNVSYFPNCYSCEEYPFGVFQSLYSQGFYVNSIDFHGSKTSAGTYTYHGSLPNLVSKTGIDFDTNLLTFTPKVDPTETYEFRILGHNFTITPELLSGNVVAEPQLSETEQKIKALEEENAKLKEENNNLQRVLISYGNRKYGDMNNDNIVDARDATILLTYYAKTSVGYTGTLDDFIKEQNGG